jgi:hypothetical protein
VTDDAHAHVAAGGLLPHPGLIPDGALGIDAGITLTKVARGTATGIVFESGETGPSLERGTAWLAADKAASIGVTGARASLLRAAGVPVQEIEAGARGARAARL